MPLTFRPFTLEDFTAFQESSTKDYAQELLRAGKAAQEAEALQAALAEFCGILPQGMATPNHFLNHLVNAQGQTVGFLWYGIRGEEIFICDFLIHEAQRRKGYGTQALEALEVLARGQGVQRIRLHVFSHNTAARKLYRAQGYREISRRKGGRFLQKILK